MKEILELCKRILISFKLLQGLLLIYMLITLGSLNML